MSANSFGTRGQLAVGDRSYEIFRLGELGRRLPYSLKILLENLLRTEDGISVREADVQALADWDGGESDREIAFAPARILMNVDLPAPLSPSTQVTSPAFTVVVTSRSAMTEP